MSFILKTIGLTDSEDIRKAYSNYYDYLNSIREKMSNNAFDFAIADWHYDPQDHRCPHDSWLEELSIVEISTGPRSETRQVEIKILLLGAYHDGYITLTYKNVIRYELEKKGKNTTAMIGHGDWLIDELRLSECKRVVHEIELSNHGHWIIECEDVIYQWKSKV